MPGFDTGVDRSAEAANQEIAVSQQQSNVPAVSSTHAAGLGESGREVTFGDDDEDDLQGLAIDSFSFPMVTQKDGMFKIGDELLGQDFQCVIQSTRPKFLYKDKEESEDSKEPKLAYSYDNPGPDATDSGGKLISDIRQEWIQAGVKAENIVSVRYLDIQCLIVGGQHDGSFATLQVPQTSIPKVSGKILELKTKRDETGKPKSIKESVLKFSAPKSVGTGTKKFYPWLVQYVRPV